jgi:MarR family 2-MHQ and catechol resistance regulon transcriptional repressor
MRRTAGDHRGDHSGAHLYLVLSRAARAAERYDRRHLESLRLGVSDFAVLESLLHKGPLPVNIIGEKVLLTSGSMTAAIDRLERRGLVERRADRDDRRARIVHLTAAGRRTARRAYDRHRRVLERIAEPLSSRERQTLIRLLRKVGLWIDTLP